PIATPSEFDGFPPSIRARVSVPGSGTYCPSFFSYFQAATSTKQGWPLRLGVLEAASQAVQDVFGLCSSLQGEVLHREALDGGCR
ncbi:hypothetical protein A2U01_0058627, partial [Trifolium medium]|nr:hypothetical protein [Trifolium medium]